MTGRYELWTFPVRIEAEGAPVKIVQLNAGEATAVFKKTARGARSRSSCRRREQGNRMSLASTLARL